MQQFHFIFHGVQGGMGDKWTTILDIIICNFLLQVCYFHHLSTHTAQKNGKMEGASHKFIEYIRRKVSQMFPDHILNMDQMPIPFLFHSKCIWLKKGAHTVHVLASRGEMKRVTLAATVTMSGELLPPLFIFKGCENGRIKKVKFQHFHKWVSMQCRRRHGWTNL